MGTTALDATPLAPSGVAPSGAGPALSATRNDPDAVATEGGANDRHRGVWCLPTHALRAQCLRPVIALFLFALSLSLYLSRLAPSLVPGDPGEYQLVAARWGIGHPPGYGFYAVVGNLFTRLLPLGGFAWRANVLAALCAAWMVALCYSIVRLILAHSSLRGSEWTEDGRSRQGRSGVALLDHVRQELPPVLGALGLATGIGFWQHAIHANAHILTALLAMLTLYCLVRWWYDQGLADISSTGAVPRRRNRWLYGAVFLAGVSPTQHPLLVFAFPAYVIFGLVVLWPVYLRRGGARPLLTGPEGLLRVLARALGYGLLGLAVYLYYPIRSAISAPPLPGPSDMHTWRGFVRIVTAQGLRGNLFGFRFGQILNRLWDVRVPLLMQFSLPGLVLAGLGWTSLWWPKRRTFVGRTARIAATSRPIALLVSVYLACILFVTVNVLQDAAAYLLGPMAVIAVLIGVGTDVLIKGVLWCVRRIPAAAPVARTSAVVVALLLAVVPARALGANWTRMDLGSFRDAEDWLAAVEARFVGSGQRATVLAEWERMTTVYFKQAVEGRGWNKDDLRFVPISAGTEAPFLHAAETYLPQGPVFLTMYRPEVASRYRLAPVPIGRSLSSPEPGWSGTLWEVLPAWPRELPTASAGSGGDRSPAWADGVVPVALSAFAPEDLERAKPLIEVVGWRLAPDAIHQRAQTDVAPTGAPQAAAPRSAAIQPGEVLALDLYMRLPAATSTPEPGVAPAFYLPWLRLGETTYRFTTHSRFNTPLWQPGEIVVERFELPVLWVLSEAAGAGGELALPLELGIVEVSRGRELPIASSSGATNEAGTLALLTSVPVAGVEAGPRLVRDLDRSLGNLRGEILLRGARINGRRVGPGSGDPLVLVPGKKMRVVLEWQSLRPIGDNYKVFVQLLDAGLQVRAQGDDKPPLGGSAPTLLWFPRWREGTRITDTYVLDVPADLEPGTYPLIVGMYGFSTFKRLPVVSYEGGINRVVVQGDWITLGHLRVE